MKWGFIVGHMKIAKCWVAVLLLLGLACVAPAWASKLEVKPAQAHEVQMGAYLTSLYDLDSSKGTFSADLWIWSKAPARLGFKLRMVEVTPLSSKFPHVYFGDNAYPLKEKTEYQVRKLQGTFLHNYEIKDFPFDKQLLKIHLENTEENAEFVRFLADPQSSYDKDITMDGWTIEGLRLVPATKSYNSNFGYAPDSPSTEYSRVTLEISLKRDAPLIFFKVTLGLFVAMILALLSSVLPTRNDDLFSARIALLGGALLAVVVNQQFADGKSGDTTAVTLIDALHMLGSLSLLLLFIASFVSRRIATRQTFPIDARRFDRIALIGISSIFWLPAVVLIVQAVYS